MTVFDDDPLMGEYPDVPARSGVEVLQAAADKLAAPARAVAEIRELHTHVPARSPLVGKHPGWCTACGVSWPCDTVRVLEGHGL